MLTRRVIEGVTTVRGRGRPRRLLEVENMKGCCRGGNRRTTFMWTWKKSNDLRRAIGLGMVGTPLIWALGRQK